MTASTTAVDAVPAATTASGTDGPARLRRGRAVGQLLACVAVFAALLAYVSFADLSSVEARTLSVDRLLTLSWEHMLLAFSAAALVVVVAIPLGILLTRGPMRRYSTPIIAVAGFGQAAPAIGLIVIAALYFGTGRFPFIGALAVYGILPVLANVVTGLDGVDRRLVEAARGMGMSAFDTLMRVELALAVPVIMTGVRTALVLMTGTAALGGFVNAGGLGTLVNTGIKLGLDNVLVVGALAIAALALFIDWLARLIEQAATPKGL
ncbi:ABC transporter permease [Mumia sp. zg.B53]|uniref:ABC transporter permease n=2 Tax=unclassified Mumia TaxID=2621872 RepID=UPI001C6EE286|nr:ABC transporter permease [Mumia sp. zg.B53]MBW9216841.1 ABC transporter permease [Mumia sp. zg.B53]